MTDAEALAESMGLPALVAQNGRWLSFMFAFPEVEHPEFLGIVRRVTEWRAAVRPWLLEDVVANPSFVVAAEFTFMNRLRVWWLNIGRRAKAREMLKRISDAEIERRHQAQLPSPQLGDLVFFEQHNHAKDGPRA